MRHIPFHFFGLIGIILLIICCDHLQVANLQEDSASAANDSERVQELQNEISSVNEKVAHYQTVLAHTVSRESVGAPVCVRFIICKLPFITSLRYDSCCIV